jgi:hypothetical protein
MTLYAEGWNFSHLSGAHYIVNLEYNVYFELENLNLNFVNFELEIIPFYYLDGVGKQFRYFIQHKNPPGLNYYEAVIQCTNLGYLIAVLPSSKTDGYVIHQNSHTPKSSEMAKNIVRVRNRDKIFWTRTDAFWPFRSNKWGYYNISTAALTRK